MASDTEINRFDVDLKQLDSEKSEISEDETIKRRNHIKYQIQKINEMQPA